MGQQGSTACIHISVVQSSDMQDIYSSVFNEAQIGTERRGRDGREKKKGWNEEVSALPLWFY